MRVHFIAIGGSAMHNLAIALHRKGYIITGSDDEIFDPAKSRLEKLGMLPDETGWFPSRISNELDAVILGMHAKEENPELRKARELGLKIYSYPEYLYEQAKDKTRVVIGGSHGKTTITAMILHVLKETGIDADYMVGAQLEGFDVMVKLSHESKLMVIEGDEYLTSALDKRPKFHVYQPDIALISGIAWDHVNVFPTLDFYIEQFRIFTKMIPAGGSLIYCAEDEIVNQVSQSAGEGVILKPYFMPEFYVRNGITYISHDNNQTELKIFGRHNMQNLEGARLVCESIGVSSHDFYKAIASFSGASKRLELIAKDETRAIYKDFAHSPSKLKATISAVREQFPQRKLIACMELHTYSSLNTEFMKEYRNTMNQADVAIVFYSKHALEIKRLPVFTVEEVKSAFANENLHVLNNSQELQTLLESVFTSESCLLMMSSGNFDGLKLDLIN